MKIFITGIAGMIGFHTAKALLKDGHDVWGIDNLNPFYDPSLKQRRVDILIENGMPKNQWIKEDICKPDSIAVINQPDKPFDMVLHLAAYPSTRHSMEVPELYIQSNIMGTSNIIKQCEKYSIPVVYASTSCVMHGQFFI